MSAPTKIPISIPKIPSMPIGHAAGISKAMDAVDAILSQMNLKNTASNDKSLKSLLPLTKAEDIESRTSEAIGEIYKVFTEESILSAIVYILTCNGAIISIQFAGCHHSSADFPINLEMKKMLLPIIFRSLEENKPHYDGKAFCSIKIEFKLNDDLQLEYCAMYLPYTPGPSINERRKIFDPGLAEDL